jgi:hypothetical protein
MLKLLFLDDDGLVNVASDFNLNLNSSVRVDDKLKNMESGPTSFGWQSILFTSGSECAGGL